jgi:hypothetical protein
MPVKHLVLVQNWFDELARLVPARQGMGFAVSEGR